MAKVMKKSSKKSVTNPKKTSPKTEPALTEVRKVAPPVPEGMVSIVMTREDMRTFANLMSIVTQTFDKLALDAARAQDENSYTVLSARQRLSSVFAEKIVEACKMPEPISRDFH